ncbi:MAG: hypothetical protein KC800_13850, partial [Candidatus Eremiobacteraeota bacterium]|nr:hypothetical protein [Candidatus Eremiobacteraeota bacterium]
MSIHLLDRELAGFDDLSLKTYRLKFQERTDPESWQIGELTGLGGPGGSILFSELWHDLVHPADREELAGVYQEILDNRSTKWRVRFRWFAENLTILHIGFFDAEKQLVEGVLLDVTEDREFRADLVQKEKIAALGLMAGGIAHDINNLLCAILSFSKFAEDDLPPDSQSRQDIAEVIKAAERAACLTKQLLTFSRQRQSPVESVDLNERVTQ